MKSKLKSYKKRLNCNQLIKRKQKIAKKKMESTYHNEQNKDTR